MLLDSSLLILSEIFKFFSSIEIASDCSSSVWFQVLEFLVSAYLVSIFAFPLIWAILRFIFVVQISPSMKA